MPIFHTYGALAVAISATLSIFACLSLGSFIAYLFIRFRHIETKDTPASSGIRFLRTQAGYLFINLLFADFLQALGFGLSYIWYAQQHIEPNAHSCLFQALAIEAGDVASAVFSLFIALHTAAALTLEKKLSNTLIKAAVICGWIFVVLLTAIGPLALYKPATGPFYAAAGNWCWITTSYDTERLYLHYLWLFVSAAGQLVSYIAVFFLIRFRDPARRFKVEQGEKKISSEYKTLSMGASPGSYRTSMFHSPGPASLATALSAASPAGRPTTSSSYILRRKLDKASVVMLLYPLVNMCIILPLSVYRLCGIAGRQTSPQALAVCGCIFSLGGFANALLYSLSRHLLRVGPTRSGRMPCPMSPGSPTTTVTNWNGMFRTPAGSASSDVTRVNSTTNTPFTSNAGNKLKELRLSPASSFTGPTKTSPTLPQHVTIDFDLEKPASALLPPVHLTRSPSTRSDVHRGSDSSRPVSRQSTPTFDVALVKVDKHTMTWSEK